MKKAFNLKQKVLSNKIVVNTFKYIGLLVSLTRERKKNVRMKLEVYCFKRQENELKIKEGFPSTIFHVLTKALYLVTQQSMSYQIGTHSLMLAKKRSTKKKEKRESE